MLLIMRQVQVSNVSTFPHKMAKTKKTVLQGNLLPSRKRDLTMKAKEGIPLKQIKISAGCLCFNSKKGSN